MARRIRPRCTAGLRFSMQRLSGLNGKTLHDFLKRDQTWTRGYGAMPNGNAKEA